MYSYIKGVTMDFGDGFAVIENNGFGYEIYMSNSTLANLRIGAECKLYLYQVVREDELSLYGFGTPQEKNMFLKLIGVSGVGPKVALGVLSGITVSNLTNAIISADAKLLSQIKGIGKKTAERIILELKEKVDDEFISLTSPQVGSAVDKVVTNALDALENMGLPRAKSYEAVVKARAETDDLAEIIRIVLKGLKR